MLYPTLDLSSDHSPVFNVTRESPMTSTIAPTTDLDASLDALSLTIVPDAEHLDNIKTQLDLVLLAIESITNISSEAMLQAAIDLGLESIVADRVSL